MSFSIIAAVGKNRELGKKGGLCFDIPGDLKFFKETTMGHPIFMGYNTWKSLPRKLPGRKHYILTHHPEDLPSDPDIIAVTDIAEFVAQPPEGEVFVIGGGRVYAEMLPYADKLYLTEVEATDPEADTFFPEFDPKDYTREVIKEGEGDDLIYHHVLYTKHN